MTQCCKALFIQWLDKTDLVIICIISVGNVSNKRALCSALTDDLVHNIMGRVGCSVL